MGNGRSARGSRQLCELSLDLLRKRMTIEVRELRAATKRTQLMHEEARTWRVRADPFGLGSVDQPNIPGVHRALAVLEPDRSREQSPERPGRVPVVLNIGIP